MKKHIEKLCITLLCFTLICASTLSKAEATSPNEKTVKVFQLKVGDLDQLSDYVISTIKENENVLDYNIEEGYLSITTSEDFKEKTLTDMLNKEQEVKIEFEILNTRTIKISQK